MLGPVLSRPGCGQPPQLPGLRLHYKLPLLWVITQYYIVNRYADWYAVTIVPQSLKVNSLLLLLLSCGSSTTILCIVLLFESILTSTLNCM